MQGKGMLKVINKRYEKKLEHTRIHRNTSTILLWWWCEEPLGFVGNQKTWWNTVLDFLKELCWSAPENLLQDLFPPLFLFHLDNPSLIICSSSSCPLPLLPSSDRTSPPPAPQPSSSTDPCTPQSQGSVSLPARLPDSQKSSPQPLRGDRPPIRNTAVATLPAPHPLHIPNFHHENLTKSSSTAQRLLSSRPTLRLLIPHYYVFTLPLSCTPKIFLFIWPDEHVHILELSAPFNTPQHFPWASHKDGVREL